MHTSTATGFIAQKELMTYATPEIEHLQHEGFRTWAGAKNASNLLWQPALTGLFTIGNKQVPDVYAVINDSETSESDNFYIGTVSNRYQLIDHDLLGKVVTAAQDMGGYVTDPISGLFVLNRGKRVGVRITRGEITLPFDSSPISKESYVWLRHDAKGALYCIENAQRLRCTNQLGFIGRGTATDLSVRHSGDVEAKIDALINTMNTKADWDLWEKEMSKLSLTHVAKDAFNNFVQEWLPISENPNSTVTRAVNAQESLMSTWERYQDELGPNLYSAYQAITEYEDQIRPARGAAGQFNRAIQPNAKKHAALSALKELASV